MLQKFVKNNVSMNIDNNLGKPGVPNVDQTIDDANGLQKSIKSKFITFNILNVTLASSSSCP